MPYLISPAVLVAILYAFYQYATADALRGSPLVVLRISDRYPF